MLDPLVTSAEDKLIEGICFWLRDNRNVDCYPLRVGGATQIKVIHLQKHPHNSIQHALATVYFDNHQLTVQAYFVAAETVIDIANPNALDQIYDKLKSIFNSL